MQYPPEVELLDSIPQDVECLRLYFCHNRGAPSQAAVFTPIIHSLADEFKFLKQLHIRLPALHRSDAKTIVRFALANGMRSLSILVDGNAAAVWHPYFETKTSVEYTRLSNHTLILSRKFSQVMVLEASKRLSATIEAYRGQILEAAASKLEVSEESGLS